jgi:hypothetical protein
MGNIHMVVSCGLLGTVFTTTDVQCVLSSIWYHPPPQRTVRLPWPLGLDKHASMGYCTASGEPTRRSSITRHTKPSSFLLLCLSRSCWLECMHLLRIVSVSSCFLSFANMQKSNSSDGLTPAAGERTTFLLPLASSLPRHGCVVGFRCSIK